MTSLLRARSACGTALRSLAAVLRGRRRVIGSRPDVSPVERYENPYRHGTCAAEWTKK